MEFRTARTWTGPVLALAALLALIASEMKLNWAERLVGSYLAAVNDDRPESGAIWEKGRKTQTARLAVDKLAADREAHQRMARNAGTLNEIIASLVPGQGVMLSAEHFRELYLRIPSGIAAEMISPFELLRFASEKRWTRAYLEKSADGLMVYLLEPNNHVLRQVRVAAGTLALMARRSDMTSQSLEDLASFQNRIYPAERFFAVLASLPEEDRRGLIAQPERLLDVSGQITRVGISDEALSGFVDMGVEVQTGVQRRVLLLQGQDWAVWRLRSLLEGTSTGSRGGQR
ncbi:MAG: hypothetical protein MUC57_07785 [Desulfobacterales bacterium]|nr:hypothetical protein [Desulfobacterales bacterium]